ncbi:hypothetical protein F8271_03980 [Micromonospora sp. ALFpr18c]|uniref:hypothetical protein n=1 Tax=unclassified Micromonospora TaxID=2617518 RepID=UPI00124B1284|nr:MULTISPECIES: hypothetical protein [unclassified Micromonospora]KAB1947689.1 hypothetical protein F8271_03980 [Micromonospora sp. ALFpr18c]MDG4759117.1 hypothetical protein [Micromonospora sp. WMMD710]
MSGDEGGVATDTHAPASIPTGFHLRTPEAWVDFSTADEASENRLADRARADAVAGGFTADQAGRYAEQVRRSVREARRSGAVHAAGVFQLYEDGPLTATVLVAVATPPASGDILGALTAVGQPARADGTWRRVSTAEIPGIGTVGRVYGIQNVTQDGATMRCAVMHTVVPMPGSADVVVVTGSSPNLAEAEDIFELFGAITETLKFTWDDDLPALTAVTESVGEAAAGS